MNHRWLVRALFISNWEMTSSSRFHIHKLIEINTLEEMCDRLTSSDFIYSWLRNRMNEAGEEILEIISLWNLMNHGSLKWKDSKPQSFAPHFVEFNYHDGPFQWGFESMFLISETGEETKVPSWFQFLTTNISHHTLHDEHCLCTHDVSWANYFEKKWGGKFSIFFSYFLTHSHTRSPQIFFSSCSFFNQKTYSFWRWVCCFFHLANMIYA